MTDLWTQGGAQNRLNTSINSLQNLNCGSPNEEKIACAVTKCLQNLEKCQAGMTMENLQCNDIDSSTQDGSNITEEIAGKQQPYTPTL